MRPCLQKWITSGKCEIQVDILPIICINVVFWDAVGNSLYC